MYVCGWEVTAHSWDKESDVTHNWKYATSVEGILLKIPVCLPQQRMSQVTFVLLRTLLPSEQEGIFLTIICFMGMKSALWRTRSKILWRWGLMKASSARGRRHSSQHRHHVLQLFFSTQRNIHLCSNKSGCPAQAHTSEGYGIRFSSEIPYPEVNP